MPNTQDITSWRGQKLVGHDGEKIGTIDEIYVDEQTGEPEWLAVSTGLFGSRVSFVPLAEAQRDGDDVRVPYSKDQVKDSPNAEADGALSQDEESRLYQHYGYDYSEHRSESGLPAGSQGRDRGRGTTGRDVSGPETDDAMTRSEEELSAVQREEVRIEREPITDANRDAALSGGDITEEEHEVTLHAEEPVVDKRTVPKERVRMDRDTVIDERQVSDEVRKERIEADGDVRRDD
jgi:sporulation protein YlmC with PRC-barrel domain